MSEQKKSLNEKSRCGAGVCSECSGAEHGMKPWAGVPEQKKFLDKDSRCKAGVCSECSGAEHWVKPWTGVSEQKNPDNVLTASKAVPKDVAEKVKQAAIASAGAFGSGANMVAFDSSKLSFSLGLMQKGKIDPLTYSW